MATELDYMEYANDATAQATYVSSETEAIDQNFETGGDDRSSIGDAGGTDYWHAVRFTTSKTILCHAVSVYLEDVVGSPTGDMTFRIETDDTNKPSGTLAHANATGIIANVSISTPTWNKCSYSLFELPAGTYWLVVYIPDQATNNNWFLTRDEDGTGYMGYSTDHGANWTIMTNQWIPYFRIYETVLQCYSEDTIKEQGSYSLKGIAIITDSLNDTLTRTVDPTIDLSDLTQIKYDIRGSRTGSHIKIGIHDSGGTTTEHTANIAQANVWQTESWDISGVANVNKDAIDSIIITITNADAANTFYIDYMWSFLPVALTATSVITTSITSSLSRGIAVALTATSAITSSITSALSRGITQALTATSVITTSITSSLSRGITVALTATSAITSSITASISRGITNALTSTVAITSSITGSLLRGITQALTSTISITTSILGRLRYSFWEGIKKSVTYTEPSKGTVDYTEPSKK